jgi:hypothetical protein
MQDNVPTHRAHILIPAGLDESRLCVEDPNGETVASVTWRPSSSNQSGPADWDWHLHRLGYDRRSPWRPDGLGFEATAARITKGASQVVNPNPDRLNSPETTP